jgi:hypothetical protein
MGFDPGLCKFIVATIALVAVLMTETVAAASFGM